MVSAEYLFYENEKPLIQEISRSAVGGGREKGASGAKLR